MSNSYAICADVHMHNWMSFATVDPQTGLNSRLMGLIGELRFVVDAVKGKGKLIVIAGDLFHVRGAVSPSVLNPVRDLFKEITKSGYRIVILAGNHDLEKREAERLTSAVTALEMPGVSVINEPEYLEVEGARLQMVPWIENIEDLKTELLKAAESLNEGHRSITDLIIHAPIDGVIEGLPSHGITGEWLAGLGFQRVFSGHYHNHKLVYDGSSGVYGCNVYSIGALAHHTWSDVGSKAGFLIADAKGSGVRFHSSRLPEFKDIDHLLRLGLTPEEVELAINGHFVRITVEAGRDGDVATMRENLLAAGARGVITRTIPKAQQVRSTTPTNGASGLESVAHVAVAWVGRKVTNPAIANLVSTKVVDVLNRAEQEEA